MPIALTEKVAVCPALIVTLAGWVVIEGATTAGVTVRVTTLLVVLPAELLTITVNSDPLSDVAATGVVYVGEVAPLMVVPFFVH